MKKIKHLTKFTAGLLMLAMLMTFIQGVTFTVSAEEVYTVTFYANNAVEDTIETTVTAGESLALGNYTFVYENCEIESWTTEADGSGYMYYTDDDLTVEKDTKLYAQWVLPLNKSGSIINDDYEWSGNESSPYSFKMKDGAVIYANVVFPNESGEDKVTLTVEGDCEIKGSIAFESGTGAYYSNYKANLTIEGDGTLTFYKMSGTGSGDTLTVLTDVNILSDYMSIGASGGMDSKIIIKDSTLTLHDLTLLESLVMEGKAKLNIEEGTASFTSSPELVLSDNSEIYIGGNGYSCVFYKEGGEHNSFNTLITDGWLPEGYSFKEENYGYYLYNPENNIAIEAITIKKPGPMEKGTVSVNEDVQTYTYDGTEKAFEIKDTNLDGFNIKYQQNGKDTTAVNAGEYDVIITRAEDDDYKQYEKTLSGALVIEAKEAGEENVTDLEDVIFTGKEIKPDIEVKDGEKNLVSGKDYDVEYQDNTDAGKAKAIITFKGNYKGSAEKEFTILKKMIDPEIPLKAPVKNKIPQTKITGDGYTATVEWSPAVEDKFDYNTEYTAVITITPDENHTLEGITEYIVKDAKSVTNEANVVTAVYDKTGSKASGGGGSLSGGASGGSVSKAVVKFETDGGSDVAYKTVSVNSKLSAPDAPVKEGFTFEGWYTEKELVNAYDFDSKVTKSFTLYAKWKEVEAEKEEEEDSTVSGGSGHNCPSLRFDDLDISQWYHHDTDYVIENNIFKGTTETKFAPHGNITRAMMITVLYRAEGEPEIDGRYTFEDVDRNAYYAKAVAWGQQNGIIKGYSEEKYAPEQDILREQIAAIMHRYAMFKGYDVSVGESTDITLYSDYDGISEYAVDAMQWAVGSGMIVGRTETTLNPGDFATRVEIAAMLHRFIESNK